MCLEFGAPLCTCAECDPMFGAYFHKSCFWSDPETNTVRYSWAIVSPRDGLAYATAETRQHADGLVVLIESRRDSLVSDALFAKFLTHTRSPTP
jgi:hypothetical protein